MTAIKQMKPKRSSKFMHLRRRDVSIVGGRWVTAMNDAGEVRVMAEAEGYSMVRFKGAMPFVVSTKDLFIP